MPRYPKAVIDEWVNFTISGSTEGEVMESLITYAKRYPKAKYGRVIAKNLWAARKEPEWIVKGTRKIEEGE